jgi:hypothetical protein
MGFELACPMCGDECSILLDLTDLTGDVRCSECDAEFSVERAIGELSVKLGQWERVREWIEAAKPILDPCGTRYGSPAPRHQQPAADYKPEPAF